MQVSMQVSMQPACNLHERASFHCDGGLHAQPLAICLGNRSHALLRWAEDEESGLTSTEREDLLHDAQADALASVASSKGYVKGYYRAARAYEALGNEKGAKTFMRFMRALEERLCAFGSDGIPSDVSVYAVGLCDKAMLYRRLAARRHALWHAADGPREVVNLMASLVPLNGGQWLIVGCTRWNERTQAPENIQSLWTIEVDSEGNDLLHLPPSGRPTAKAQERVPRALTRLACGLQRHGLKPGSLTMGQGLMEMSRVHADFGGAQTLPDLSHTMRGMGMPGNCAQQ